MNISAVKRAEGDQTYTPAPMPKSGDSSFNQSFQQQMDHQERQEYQRQAEALFEELRSDAGRLLRERDLTLFENYRQRMALLLKEILCHAYLFRPERVRDGRGQERIYATVTVVDEKLDQLGAELLSENKKQLDIMSRVDEIRGLVMDLFT